MGIIFHTVIVISFSAHIRNFCWAIVDILLFPGMVKALTPTAEDASATADADVVMVKNMQKLVKKRQYIFSSTKTTSNSFGWSIRYRELEIPSVL
ncbi:hypothetical protein AVEN_90891-1 [Araneus ventricosus]|uniref:Uncharacterized protein n=1 Tax=Araneus ventricosus TaxID=182803 RepID=A0A4Y2SSH6_ARAVE|nr:hypothetical protein AVEN_90891-1 [Araneus ventricosus]